MTTGMINSLTNFPNLSLICFFRYISCSSHNKVEIGPKINKLLVTYQTRALNATLRYDVQRSWGYFDEKTGIANGMFGQIQRKEADISGIEIIKFFAIFLIRFWPRIRNILHVRFNIPMT